MKLKFYTGVNLTSLLTILRRNFFFLLCCVYEINVCLACNFCVFCQNLLEKALESVKKQEPAERDMRKVAQLRRQRDAIEQELSRCRQQLAESSRVNTLYIHRSILVQ